MAARILLKKRLPPLRIEAVSKSRPPKIALASAQKHVFQSIEKRRLAFQDFRSGGRNVEPGGPVDFRKLLSSARARRPLEAESIADESGRIPVVFDRPGMNPLSPRLPQRSKRKCLTAGRIPGLLRKLPEGGLAGLFAKVDFAFRNGPRTIVLLAPIGAARMRKQDLEAVAVAV